MLIIIIIIIIIPEALETGGRGWFQAFSMGHLWEIYEKSMDISGHEKSMEIYGDIRFNHWFLVMIWAACG